MRHCGTENDLRDDGFRNCGAATPNAASQSRRSAIAADVAACRVRHGPCDEWLPVRRRLACIRIPEKGRCLERFDEECRTGQQ